MSAAAAQTKRAVETLQAQDFTQPLQVNLFCGSQSALAQSLRAPFRADTPWEAVFKEIDRLSAARDLRWSKSHAFKADSHASAQSLSHLVKAAVASRKPGGLDGSDQKTMREWFDLAVKVLPNDWRGGPQVSTELKNDNGSADLANARAAVNSWNVATEVCWHVLEQWGVDPRPGLGLRTGDELPTSAESASSGGPASAPLVTVWSPVLAADVTGPAGEVLWLKVELFERIEFAGTTLNGQLIPDLCGMGMTAIDKKCLDAFAEVWQGLKLDRWVRGVWRLDTVHPPNFDKEVLVDAESTQHHTAATALGGQSAQAAMLIALLSATGIPDEYEPTQEQRPPFKPEPLRTTTAISAAVDFSKSAASIRDLALTPIGKTFQKATAAQKKGMQSVVFAEQEKLTGDSKEAEEQTKAASKPQPTSAIAYTGLWIERAATVEEAVDLLLERNKYLRAYQASIQSAWDDLWLPEEPATPAENSSESAEHV